MIPIVVVECYNQNTMIPIVVAEFHNQKTVIPIVVAKAEVRSTPLTHLRTEIKQKDTKIYVVWRDEILLHPRVVANHYNQSVYKVYLSPSHTTKTLLQKFL